MDTSHKYYFVRYELSNNIETMKSTVKKIPIEITNQGLNVVFEKIKEQIQDENPDNKGNKPKVYVSDFHEVT